MSKFKLIPTPRTWAGAAALLLLAFFAGLNPASQPSADKWPSQRLAALFAPTAAAQASASVQTRVYTETPRPQKPPRTTGIFFNKLRTGKTVTVAYLGGTMTAGVGASDAAKTSYRALVTNWLRQNFKEAQISELNAGVAGTGALYGAMRVRRDVIAYKPDLVFIEFALQETNDAPETQEGVQKALEGILRQLLIVPQPPEVVLLYTTNAQRAARLEWLETIAAHYQLPAVNLQSAIWQQIEARQLKPTTLWPAALSKDGTVPGDEGHKLYAKLITDFLSQQAKLESSPIPKVLPSPLVSDEMNYGEIKAIAEFKHGPAWHKESNQDRTLPSLLLSSDKANAQVELYFEGSVLGLSFRVGPDGGMFECLIDGKPAPAPLNKIDAYAGTAHIQTRLIPGGLGMNEHKLTIRVLSEKNPKSSSTAVRLGSLLVGGQRPERL
jgi:acyl-CoA thioesterase-1